MTTKYRIVLAEPREEVAQALRRLLDRQPNLRVVGVARSGEELLNLVASLTPDLVLVAERLEGGEDGIEAAARLRDQSPLLPILLLAAREDLEQVRRAMRAGVRDVVVLAKEDRDRFLAEVETLAREGRERTQEVVETILRSPGPGTGPLAPLQGYRITVFGTKGGVGKTTLAVNLALQLTIQEKLRTVFVDGDLYFGDACIHLNVLPRHTLSDLCQAAAELDAEAVRRALVRHPTGLRVLCGAPRPEAADLVTADGLGTVLELVAQLGQVIVVDGSASYDERMLKILDHSDRILLVVTPEIGPLRNTLFFLDLAESLGYAREEILLVLNRADSDVGVTPQDVEKRLNLPVTFTIPSGGKEISRSINEGVPLSLRDPDHPVVQAIGALAQALAEQARAALGQETG